MKRKSTESKLLLCFVDEDMDGQDFIRKKIS